jgi:hypothetical protein
MVRHRRFKTDFEQENDDADAREAVHRGICFDASKPADPNEIETPKRTSTTSSPSTAGCRTRPAKWPPSLAAAKTIASANTTGVTGSTCAAVVW